MFFGFLIKFYVRFTKREPKRTVLESFGAKNKKNMIFRKRCAPRFHAECTGRCVEIFHGEPIREKNVIFKKVAFWYPGIPVTDPW